MEKIKKFFKGLNKRSLKYGSVSIVLSALFIAIIIFVNVFAGIATDKFGIKFDMTSDRRFAITDESKKILKNLHMDATIYVLATENEMRERTFGNEIVEVLNRFKVTGGGRVELVFLDPLRNPDFINKHKSSSQLNKYSVVVETIVNGEPKFRVIPGDDVYYYYDSTNSTIVGISIERRVSSALLWLQSNQEVQPVAAVSVGNGEVGYTGLRDNLTEAGYEAKTVDLLTNDIPENTELLIISSPSRDFTEEEINKIEAYLKTYKYMIVSLGAMDSPSLPILEQFLAEWGVVYGEALVMDPQYSFGNERANIFSYAYSSDNPFLNGLSRYYVAAPASRPMYVLWDSDTTLGSRTTSKLLWTNTSTAYAKDITDVINEIIEKAPGDATGPFYTAIMSTQTTIINNRTVEGGILFLSSPYIYNANVLNTGSYGNMQFITNILGQFNGTGAPLSIRSKSFIPPELTVIGGAMDIVLVLLCSIPAVLILMGGVVWYRRKNR